KIQTSALKISRDSLQHFALIGCIRMNENAGEKQRFDSLHVTLIFILVVMLCGVSLMGVPLPHAWLGNMKNIDVFREYGGTPGIWKAFADGVSDVHVEDGLLTVMLRE
ncbi:MAG: hypothetical protein JW902_09875, partial [Syntrophaceae bacterium]|nr:hypothetical protein [Syntrophaceae bacterium]